MKRKLAIVKHSSRHPGRDQAWVISIALHDDPRGTTFAVTENPKSYLPLVIVDDDGWNLKFLRFATLADLQLSDNAEVKCER